MFFTARTRTPGVRWSTSISKLIAQDTLIDRLDVHLRSRIHTGTYGIVVHQFPGIRNGGFPLQRVSISAKALSPPHMPSQLEERPSRLTGISNKPDHRADSNHMIGSTSDGRLSIPDRAYELTVAH